MPWAEISAIGAVKNVLLVRLHPEGKRTHVHARDRVTGREFAIEVEKKTAIAGIARVGIVIGTDEIVIVDQKEIARRNRLADSGAGAEIETNEEDGMIVAK